MSMSLEQLIKITREEAADQRLQASCYTHLDNYRVKAKHDELANRADNLDQLADWLEELKKLREDAKPAGEWARHDEWRNGEYIGGFYHVKCPCDDGYYSKWETNFCPNCGAVMRKGDTE